MDDSSSTPPPFRLRCLSIMPAGMSPNACFKVRVKLNYVVDNFQDQERRELFLALLRRIEPEPSLLGASAHLLAIARKEEQG